VYWDIGISAIEEAKPMEGMETDKPKTSTIYSFHSSASFLEL